MPDLVKLARLESSHDARQGRCAVFDGETTCGLAINHRYDRSPTPHRFYDPSGSGRWIEKDDYGVELRRGPDGAWQQGCSSACSEGHRYGPGCELRGVDPEPTSTAYDRLRCGEGGTERCVLPAGHKGRHRAGEPNEFLTAGPVASADRPATCGDFGPALLAGIRPHCVLPVRHEGMHRAEDGMEWGLLPPEQRARMRRGRSVGRTLYLAGPGESDDQAVLVGLMDTPELAAEVVRRWNSAS